jgi:ATP-dependent Clp protease ATP-binding subunit ClpB
VFDILLQVLDDGRTSRRSGAHGRTHPAILILTSNLGSPILIDPTLTLARSVSRSWRSCTAFRPSSSTGSTTS